MSWSFSHRVEKYSYKLDDVENQFPDSEEEEDNTTINDQILIKQLKENISKNSIAIADLNISSSNSQTTSEPRTPQSRENDINKKKKTIYSSRALGILSAMLG